MILIVILVASVTQIVRNALYYLEGIRASLFVEDRDFNSWSDFPLSHCILLTILLGMHLLKNTYSP